MSERRRPNTLAKAREPEQAADSHEANWPPAETISDNLRVERQVFRFNDTSVVFRAQEELPDFGPALGVYGHASLLTPEAQPTYASLKDYQAWGQKHQAETGQPHHDCLIAPATPLGVLDVAISLTGKGLAPGQIGQLDQLRAKLRDGVFDDEVGRLYDVLFASATIGNDGPSRERALIETALCLANDPNAIETVNAKLAERQHRDQQNWNQVYGGRPGRHPNPEQLDNLQTKRLVAVHTTQARPEGRILPTATYNQDNKDHVPRTTIHTSLNHPAESHMWGSFENNKYTVVSPLAEMVDLNGVPDVMNSVDTYFTVNPVEGLGLPDETILVELRVDQPDFVTVDGRRLSVREGPVLAGDLAELAGISSQLTASHYTANEMFTNLIKSVDGVLWRELGCLKTGEVSMALGKEAHQTVAELKRLYQQTVESDDPRYQKNPTGSRAMARRLLTHYTELDSQSAAAYPAVTQALQESVRQFLVRESISHLGGVNVEGGPHYSDDSNFNRSVAETAQDLGIRQSLHQNQPEAYFEKRAYRYKRDVFDPPQPALGAELNDDDLYWQQDNAHRGRKDLDSLWGKLEQLSPEWRQAALRGDFLTYTPPSTVELEPPHNIV